MTLSGALCLSYYHRTKIIGLMSEGKLGFHFPKLGCGMAFRVIYLFESRPKLAVRIIGHSFTTAVRCRILF